MRLEVAGTLDQVGPEWDPLFLTSPGLQSRRLWFEATVEAALPPGASPRFVLLRDEQGPACLMPMLAGPARRMGSLTSPYTCLYQPLAAVDLSPARLLAAGAAFGRYCRSWPVVVLDALDPAWPGWVPFLAGVRRAGIVVRHFDHFGNWRQDVAGWTWTDYLASRPGRLRETIRRKLRAAGRNDQVRMEVVRCQAALGPAMAAYEAVYQRSWKGAEPFPLFNAALLHRAMAVDAARLGVMWLGQQPVAAQYWTVLDGVATVLKLAHDEAYKPLSPGTVLTAHMVRTLLEQERVVALDFGRGDDDYKKLWASERRQREGRLLICPWWPRGVWTLLRQEGGRLHRQFMR